MFSNQEGKRKKKKKHSVANYFVSLPITNEKILENIQIFQDSVVQKDDRFSSVMKNKGSYHLTLCLMQINREEDVSIAIDALLESKVKIEDILQGKDLVLQFLGVSHFNNQVVFAKIAEDPSKATLKEITDTVKNTFKDKELFKVVNNSSIPHLTLMNMESAPDLQEQGVIIYPSLYRTFRKHYFGDETVSRLDLCSMDKARQPDGYYHTEASIFIGHSLKTFRDS
ncbi:A-kinase anchor protein 7-like isoform X1 [Rana temporaria]|uniref:A-kinase anchor protein 7-like isoform X1 n=2 Tax=Rana temporaria TaxID=8407 RepID=UPI001AAC69EC|nr:A-kinase anchor protein 7-like isoform X1 [Rana temporaria]